MKKLVVVTAAVIGLQGMAFAAVSQQPVSVQEGKYAQVQAQDAAKAGTTSSTVMPLQVASRLSSGLRINTACDDTGLPCPRPHR
ncbi:hypothetical protein K5D34_04925 [Pseudomonas cichorii]|uniref:Uncharacterized protein n=1 Tax=Pseudomonas lijiangensis TaxID=2995658 RepID=A0ABX8I3W3_9PSED|nr:MULTISPECIES: hypothetical protein [Pseudomonas syringae group]MBX8486845.1 hypothetical protein [Pseudomonas cichorii]MBX8490889.1 hypothetical protein [Pseudomonas cichorii]MBX8499181.1 hypothetical protein [Pseudomonas lijiangensis]MBX8504760.1 hypothetical protein [Pseudomonas lijiangensis]MBX8509031.1 hypothetical protein [Pseudomonas cichorii]